MSRQLWKLWSTRFFLGPSLGGVKRESTLGLTGWSFSYFLIPRPEALRRSWKFALVASIPSSSTKIKQDWNSTYRYAILGLRISNIFNLFSLPIWVTFKFEWHKISSDLPVWVALHFELHSIFSDIPFWVTFHFEWLSVLIDIPFWGTVHFQWHTIWNNFPF